MADLTVRERESIFRCFNEFYKDSQNISASICRVAIVFQVSERTVRNVIAQARSGKPVEKVKRIGRVKNAYFFNYAFKEALNDFCFVKIKQNEHLTIELIYKYAQECLDFNYSETTLYRIIKSIGYAFKKVDRRKIFIETPRIVSWRIRFCHRYLELLTKHDVKFIFLDETWIYQNGSQVRQWTLENNPKGVPSKFKAEGKRYTILNAGCSEGFLPNCDLILDTKINDRDYHKTMNGVLFSNWVKEKLIPALRTFNKKCVIILDNAPYHSVKVEKPPTASSKKDDLKQWLENHNISFNVLSTKKELIKPHVNSGNFIKYKVDEMLKMEGHEVLRLPPYNCQYNPIELAWADCKKYYKSHITAKLDSRNRVIQVWQEALQQCGGQKWQNFIEHAQQEVKNDWHKYMGVHDIDDVPPFIINLESDSESDYPDFDEQTTFDNTDDKGEPLTTSGNFDLDTEEITLMVVDDDESDTIK